MVLLPWRNTAGWGSFTGAHDGRSREKITSGCTKCFWSFTTISLLLWTDDSVSKGTAYLQSWRWSVRGARLGKFSLIHSYSTRSLTSSTLTWKTATASWAHFCPFFPPEKKKNQRISEVRKIYHLSWDCEWNSVAVIRYFCGGTNEWQIHQGFHPKSYSASMQVIS